MLVSGVTEEQFWDGNPRTLKPYKKAYDIRTKERMQELDYSAWLFGLYNLRAVEVPIAHFGAGLSGKTSDIKYHDKPISQQPKQDAEGNDILPVEEQIERVKMLFTSLEIRKTNFELNKEQREGSGE